MRAQGEIREEQTDDQARQHPDEDVLEGQSGLSEALCDISLRRNRISRKSGAEILLGLGVRISGNYVLISVLVNGLEESRLVYPQLRQSAPTGTILRVFVAPRWSSPAAEIHLSK